MPGDGPIILADTGPVPIAANFSLSCLWVAQFSSPFNGVSSLPLTPQSAVAPRAAAELQRASALAQKRLGSLMLGPRCLSCRAEPPLLQSSRPSPARAGPGPAPWSQLTDEGQRPAAPRAVIRAAGSRSGVFAALVRSLPRSLLVGELAPRPRATPLSRDAESRSNTESTEANFHFPLAELSWPALGTAF